MNHGTTETWRRYGWLALPLAAFVATRVGLLRFEPQFSDADLYCEWALNTVDLGLVPYRDVPIDYPPLAYRVLTLPRVLAAQRIPPLQVSEETFKHVLPEYLATHRRIMAVFDAASFLLLLAIAHRRRPDLLVLSAWAYVILTTLLAHVILERLDVGLSFFLLAWAYCWVRSAETTRWRWAWSAGAYVALGLGAAYKLIPALLAPPLLVSEWRSAERGGWARAGVGMLWFSLALLSPFAWEYQQAGPDLLEVFRYHAERGIQLESIYASALMAIKPLGVSMQVVLTHKAWDLSAGSSAALAAISSLLILGLVAATSLWAMLTRQGLDRLIAYRVALWTLAATLLVSKVLSPQFFIWGLPILLLLGLETLSRRQYFLLLAALIVMTALTTAIFPYHYDELRQLTPLPCTLLILRNALFAMTVCWLGWRTFRFASSTDNWQLATDNRPNNSASARGSGECQSS